MNFSRGQTVANLVVAALSADGRITIANDVTGTVHVIADLVGYFAPTGGSTYTPVNPQRMLDTRYGPDGRSKGFTPGSDNVMPITGVGTGVPLDATAVVFNLTVTEPSEVGYLSRLPRRCSTTARLQHQLQHRTDRRQPRRRPRRRRRPDGHLQGPDRHGARHRRRRRLLPVSSNPPGGGRTGLWSVGCTT